MSKGFGGGGGNVNALLKQAKDMQSKLEQAHTDAQAYTADGQAGGGMVKVVARGNNTIESITINPQVVDPNDVEMLQEMVLAAVNNALTDVQGKVQETLSKITGGMGIPGLF